jgi:hypothetical protein
MDSRTTKYYELVKSDYPMFLNYMKAKMPLFHNSNLFVRDFEYSVKRFLEKKELKVTQPEAEIIASEFGSYLIKEGVFIPVNDNAWKLNYPEFVTVKPGDPL